MSLTTPVPRDEDVVFPGESWFYYWKTSASLWRTKMAQHQNHFVIVPINWSFHSDTGDTYDFAQHRPETDLKRLSDIAHELGKKCVFFLPLTPAPFLANGGLPHLLARTLSLSDEQMGQVVVDSDGGLNRIYTFYDTRVYQAFTRFTHRLAEYFGREKIHCDVWGIKCYQSYHDQYRSFMCDSSHIFDQSFGRYLKAKKEEDNLEIQSVDEEQICRIDYQMTIEQLYLENASKTLSNYWEGCLDICFLGASSADLGKRLTDNDSDYYYTSEVLKALRHDMLPSSVLLHSRLKKDVLGKMLNEIVQQSFLPLKLEEDNEALPIFKPLVFFEINTLSPLSPLKDYNWKILGLDETLERYFPNSYRQTGPGINLEGQETPDLEHVHFFLGESVDKKLFHHILKLFMSGGRVVLDRTHLDQEYLKKLEVFFLENSLSVEKVHFHTSVHNINLGEGRLVVFEGENLEKLEPAKKMAFWSKLISTFDLRNVQLESPAEAVHFWQTRAASNRELNYEEIRRISLFNPTSYKKKYTLKLPKTFAFLKVVDPHHAQVDPSPHQLEISLLPDGCVSIDFGVFS